MLPKKEEAPRPHVFNFNKFFMNACFVANAGGDLAQMSSQVKMKEEDFKEEFNPWNKDVKLLEKMLNSHDSIMKEGKDDREVAKMATSKARVSKPKNESSKRKVSIEDNNSNLKQREEDKSKKQKMDKPKDMLDIEIEEIWQQMMKQFKWRKMVTKTSKINQKLNLIDKKKKMEQKTVEVQRQQRNKASRQLQNKV